MLLKKSRCLILSVFQHQYLECPDHQQQLGGETKEAAKIQQFYALLTSSIEVIRRFCDRIPGIGELCPADRELLFQSACLELFALRLAYRYERVNGDIAY